jgi:hypothetical protein
MSGPGGDAGVVVGADVVLSLVGSSLVGSLLVGTSVVVPSVGGALVSGTAVVVSPSVLVTEGVVIEVLVIEVLVIEVVVPEGVLAGVRECGCEITRGCASATELGAVLVARAGDASSDIEMTAAPAAANTRIRRARGR